jgi:hypothetical protein
VSKLAEEERDIYPVVKGVQDHGDTNKMMWWIV